MSSSALPSISSITSLFSSSTELSRLSLQRAQAKAALESSPLWIAWSAAVRHLSSEESELVTSTPSSPPVLTPKDALALAVGGFESWDMQDPGVTEYARASQLVAERRRVEELMQQLESSAEWQMLVRLDHELKICVRRGSTLLRNALMGMNGDAQVAQDSAPRGASSSVGAAPSSVGSVNLNPPTSIATADIVIGDSVAEPSEPAASCPTAAPSSDRRSSKTLSSSASKDTVLKLKVPVWCTQLISDPYEVVPELGLGLTGLGVYRDMCDSEQSQVQRVWSTRDGHSALAALSRAVEFHVDMHFQHPSTCRLDEARQRLVQQVSAWSEDRFKSVVPSAVGMTMTKSEYIEKVLSSPEAHSDVSVLYIYRATIPGAPRIYVITVHKRKGVVEEARTVEGAVSEKPDVNEVPSEDKQERGISLEIIGDDDPEDAMRCIILYQNLTVPAWSLRSGGLEESQGS